jgi:hypothetical protein
LRAPDVFYSATAAGTREVWLTAATLAEDGSRIVVELRRGAVEDGRPRIDPDADAQLRLRIITLGRTCVDSGGRSIDGDWLDKRAGQLLRYLVVHDRGSSDRPRRRGWPTFRRAFIQSGAHASERGRLTTLSESLRIA